MSTRGTTAASTPEAVTPADVTAPLIVSDVDLNIPQTTKSHRTSDYDITRKPQDEDVDWTTPQLVVRRGQMFGISLKTNRLMDTKKDKISVHFKIGDSPKPNEGTDVRLNVVNNNLKAREWGAALTKFDEGQVLVHVMPAADCPVGKWRVTVNSYFQDDSSGEKNTFDVGEVYILFNPWCKDDQVYLADEDLRDEYVVNDSGKIFTGSYYQIWYKAWSFAQFEDMVLDCSLHLLDKVQLKMRKRGDPIAVCRAFSAIVNEQNDDGLLAGNWSGDYTGGTSPLKWVGTHSILQEYWRTKSTVSFAQCWVFSAVSTTLCRALGIPTRSVTNFASAHDTDGSISIDKYFDQNGEALDSNDSIWNFHVWNEAWMNRPDLIPGFGGWQAFDATPQEESPQNRIYCAGPASVKAIKEGEVNLPYDARFIFAEVNADEIHWTYDEEEDEFRKSKLNTHKVGKHVSTKWPRQKPKRGLPFIDRFIDRLDITNEYKYDEGTQEERKAVLKAALHSKNPDLYDETETDVKFELKFDPDVMVGSNFDVIVKLENTSDHVRTIASTVTVTSTTYTGVPKGRVISKHFETALQPKPEHTGAFVLSVSVNDYLPHLTQDASFQITVVSKITETNQWDTDIEKYRLRMPDLKIAIPEYATVGETVYMTVQLLNPLPIKLTNCEMLVEGAGLQKPQTTTTDDVRPNGHWNVSLPITPRKEGAQREIMASFMSTQLEDVQGYATINVVA